MLQLYSNKNIEKIEEKSPLSIFGRRVIKPNLEMYNKAVESFGKAYLQKIVQIHNSAMKDKIRLEQITDALDFIEEYQKESNKSYLQSLIFPERTRNVRVPSKFPIPTLTFHQKNQFTVTPNNSGNFLVQWNCQSLYDNSTANPTYSDLWINTAATLTGAATGNASTASRVNFLNVSGTLNAYRLVSATILVTYIGSIDAHAGVIGGGIDINIASSAGGEDTSLTNFTNVDDKMFSYQSLPFNGLKLNYFPKDYADLNFYKIPDNTAATQLNSQGLSSWIKLIVYGQNLPSGSSIRIDLYRNFEAIPASSFSDMVSAQLPIQKNPVNNLNDNAALDDAKKMVDIKAAAMTLPEAKALADSGLVPKIDEAPKGTVLQDFREFLDKNYESFDAVVPGNFAENLRDWTTVADRSATRVRDKGFNAETVGMSLADVLLSKEGLRGTIQKIPEKFLSKIPVIGDPLKKGYRWITDKLFGWLDKKFYS